MHGNVRNERSDANDIFDVGDTGSGDGQEGEVGGEEEEEEEEEEEGIFGRDGPGHIEVADDGYHGGDTYASEPVRSSRMDRGRSVERMEREIFTPYKCPKLPCGWAVKHCGNVVESSSLAAVQPPDVTHQTLIPQIVIKQGRLSDLQLEAVIYAGQRHSQYNMDGTRGGFMLGDGTGVGKGRTCAGIIYDYFLHERQQRRKHPLGSTERTRPIVCVWISVSWDLAQDARRDLTAITEPLEPEHDDNQQLLAPEVVLPVVTVRDAQAASFSLDAYSRSGVVIFATYSVFSRGESSASLKTLRALMANGQPDTSFHGVVAFDEAHNAKNLVPGRGKASKTGLYIKRLQDEFLNARIVYASATGASEVRNMGYMTRLGLWGEGTPFSDFAKVPLGKRAPAFVPELKKGGFGAMELVGMDLKAQGRYLCRTLSFSGATFTVSEARLSIEQQAVYDEAAALWQRLIVICKNGRFWAPVEGVNLKTFWAAQQLFFRQLLCAFKVGHTIGLIEDALKNGRSVIVGVQLTGDSRVQEMLKVLMKDRDAAGGGAEDDIEIEDEYNDEQTRQKASKKHSQSQPKKRRAATDAGELEDAFSSTKETFTRLIENCWASTENIAPALVRHLRTCQGDIAQVLNFNQRQIAPSDAQYRRHKIWKDLADRAEALQFPVNPIDGILQHFGSSRVAEVTGRRLRAESRDNGRVEYVSRSASAGLTQARLNLAEQNSFVNAAKRIIIISQAGSSGISLHAGFDFPNQQPRTHIILELPWSSEQLIQQCGRSHRSNQLSAPEFIAISTDVAGETRFAMSVAARMQSLGAITKSDRRAAHCTSQALERFNFVTSHGRNALRELQSNTQLQALSRLAGGSNASRRATSRAHGRGLGRRQLSGDSERQSSCDLNQHAVGVSSNLQLHACANSSAAQLTKRQHLSQLGLHESASNKEMREKFIGRGIVCFVDRQMSDRELKACQNIRHQSNPATADRIRKAERDRSAAARRLLAVKTSYECASGEHSVPIKWAPSENSKFPLAVRRALAEMLKVFKRKESEWGTLPPKVAHNIFCILAVGKPEPASNTSGLSVGWLHPPEPAVELFCLLLLLDVVKAPTVRRNSEMPANAEFDTVYAIGSGGRSAESKLSIETFFNRMLAMSTTWQKRVFAYFTDIHENVLAEAEAAGDSALAGVTCLGSGQQQASLAAEELVCIETDSGSAVMHVSLDVESGDVRLLWKQACRKLRECGELSHDGSSSVVSQAVEMANFGANAGPLSTEHGAAGAICGFFLQKRSKRAVLVVKERLAATYAMWRPNSRKFAERRRLTYRQLCERLKRFSALSEDAARTAWMAACRKLGDRAVEKYHLITGPVLACWHVIKDCAARVSNESDHNAQPDAARGDPEETDKPDTTLSIVRAVLTNGRRIIGLHIDDDSVSHVCAELKRQHEAGWHDHVEGASSLAPLPDFSLAPLPDFSLY